MQNGQQRPSGARKRLARRVVLLLSVFALLAVAAFSLRTRTVRDYARLQAINAIHRQLGLHANINDVDLEPMQLALVARGIVLWHPRHGRLARVDLLRIRPSLLALVRGKIDLKAVDIEDARLFFLLRDGRVVNLPALSGEPVGGRELELPFERLTIKRSSLQLDASPFGRGEIYDISAAVDRSRGNVARVRLLISSGFFDHELGRERLRRLEVDATVTSDNLQIALLRLSLPGLELGVRRAALNFPLGQGYHGDLDVKLDLDKLDRLPHGIELPPLRGLLALKASVTDNESGPGAGGKLVLENASVKGYGLGERLEMDFEADGERVQFKGFTRLIREAGQLDLEGEIGLGETLPLDVRVQVDGVSFAVLMEQLSISPDAIVDWNLGGGFELQGTLAPFSLSGPLSMPTRDFRVTVDAWHQKPAHRIIGVSSADLKGKVRVNEAGIHLEHMQIDLPRSTVRANVLLGFDDALRVKGESERLEMKDCTPLVDLSLEGGVGFGVEIGGTFMQPEVRGRIDAKDFVLDGFPLGDLESDFRLEKDSQAVRFASVKGEKRDSRFRVEDLFLDFTDGRFAASGDLHAQQMTLEDFFHVFHLDDDERYNDYRGVFSGLARIHYTLGFPDDSPSGTLDGDLDLDLPELRVGRLAFDQGRLHGRFKWLDHNQGYRTAELEVERLSLKKGGGTVNISGGMKLGGELEMVAVADGIDLRHIEPFAAGISALQGTLGMTGTVGGTAEIPRYDFDVTLSGLGWRGRALGDARLYLRLADRDDPWVREALDWESGAATGKPCGRARRGLAGADWPADPPLRTVNGPQPALPLPMAYLICGQALKGRVRIDMAFGRTKLYPLRGTVEFEELPLDPFLPEGTQPERLQGKLSGRIELERGALLAPDTLTGNLTVQKLSLGSRRVEIRNQGPLELTFERGSFEIKRAVFTAPDSDLRISGGGSLHRGLGLGFEGKLNLGLLSSFARTFSQTRGHAYLRFKVTGPVWQPEVFGEAEVRDAALHFAGFPEPIEELKGRVTFSARRVLLEGFSARAAGGTIRLGGAAELSGLALGSYALDISTQHLKLPYVEEHGIEALFGGQARLSWKKGDRLPLLSGTMRLESLRYTKPMQATPMLSDMYRRQRVVAERYDPEQDRVALDLKVVHDQPLRIANNLLDAELVIRDSEQPFRIEGTDQRFGILGTMSFKRGVLRFRDRDFDIRQGEISFADPGRLDPRFDLIAVTDIRRGGDVSATSWHITMHAKGNKDAFDLKTSSDPYLSEEDIALLLTVGMTRAEIEQSQTGDLTETAALEALAGVTGVSREVHRAVPVIDDFRIKSAYSESSHRTEPQVSIGKRIADRVRLNASTGLAESREFQTGLQWQLSDQTSMEAVYDNQNNTTGSANVGDLGLDLTWRLEFD
jgi:translocation and assembly module TamB